MLLPVFVSTNLNVESIMAIMINLSWCGSNHAIPTHTYDNVNHVVVKTTSTDGVYMYVCVVTCTYVWLHVCTCGYTYVRVVTRMYVWWSYPYKT